MTYKIEASEQHSLALVDNTVEHLEEVNFVVNLPQSDDTGMESEVQLVVYDNFSDQLHRLSLIIDQEELKHEFTVVASQKNIIFFLIIF